MGLRTALGLKKRPVISADLAKVFDGKDFTADWTTSNIGRWQAILGYMSDMPVKILEVGSCEGRSAVAFLNILPRSSITCVDQFPPGWSERFDANTAEFGRRVLKIKSNSDRGLSDLVFKRGRFEVIYIDGDHSRAGVLIDSMLAWQMLAPGGIMVWDDYHGGQELPSADRPQEAIDYMLKIHEAEIDLLHKGYQVIVRRRF